MSPRLTLLAMVVLCVVTSCTNTADVADPNRLCPTGAGVGARITGTPQPLDMCVSNQNTITEYGVVEPNRFCIASSFTLDSLAIDIEISFLRHTVIPSPLNVTADPGIAFADFDGALFQYREVKQGAYDYHAVTASGTFVLTFSDTAIATGTFSDLKLDLEDTSNTPVGMRTITEGIFSVSRDN